MTDLAINFLDERLRRTWLAAVFVEMRSIHACHEMYVTESLVLIKCAV